MADDDDINPHHNIVYELTEHQWEHFIHTMQNPKPPTPAMIAAAEMMRELARGQQAVRDAPGIAEYDSWTFS